MSIPGRVFSWNREEKKVVCEAVPLYRDQTLRCLNFFSFLTGFDLCMMGWAEAQATRGSCWILTQAEELSLSISFCLRHSLDSLYLTLNLALQIVFSFSTFLVLDSGLHFWQAHFFSNHFRVVCYRAKFILYIISIF